MTTVKTRKKLIEVALPLEAINKASAHEKMPGIGPHPRGLHLYWARRPLAAARAVIFAQMVDDPSALPELFKTEIQQKKERKRLFRIIEELVDWENICNEEVLEKARQEIVISWRRACADNADHPRAMELFTRANLPAFHDPFSGGGALPLEAQRLGLESHASDLNPVAVMINKAMVQIPPRHAGRPPVRPRGKEGTQLLEESWSGAQGLAEDVQYYGKWMLDSAREKIGASYPTVKVDANMASRNGKLSQLAGQELKVIAWLWARTVKSPNPAFRDVDVPLCSSFVLSTRKGNEAYIKPVIERGSYKFEVIEGCGDAPEVAKRGTRAGAAGGGFSCLMSGAAMPFDYLRKEAKAGRLGTRLMAIVVEGSHGRIYLPPNCHHEDIALKALPEWTPDQDLPEKALGFRIQEYGMTKWADLFTKRQLLALTTLSDLVVDARSQIKRDTGRMKVGLTPAEIDAYANDVSVYLSFAVDRCADFGNTCTRWVAGNQKVMNLYGKQAIAMTWDFPEAAVLENVVGGFGPAVDFISKCILKLPQKGLAFAEQQNAMTSRISSGKVISTDPPYYDNIGYADLSDFFYVWMSRSLKDIYPELFSTLGVPKVDELIATPFRHGSKKQAEAFFLNGMTEAMKRLSEEAHPAFPVTIYYAFKQSEEVEDGGTSNTGWDTFLAAVIDSGLAINGTWPMRSEQANRMVGMGANALASSIVLVCRPISPNAPTATRKDFISALKGELPVALAYLQAGNIAPVDLAQAAIGPGMAIYTRYKKVIGSDGAALTVRDALTLVNQVLDEQLSEQEGNWDSDTRWAARWFDQFAFSSGDFGQAELLATAKNTSVKGIVDAGVALSSAGKVRLFKPEELPQDWAPESDTRLTVWEMLHHLIRLQKQGEEQASAMLARLGDKADAAKELAYRLYGICERKKRSAEGQLYNDLIVVWPDLVNQSKQAPAPTARPGEFELDA